MTIHKVTPREPCEVLASVQRTSIPHIIPPMQYADGFGVEKYLFGKITKLYDVRENNCMPAMTCYVMCSKPCDVI